LSLGCASARKLNSDFILTDALLPSEAAGGGGDRGLTPHPINRVRDVKNLRTNPVLDNVNIFVDVTVKHITYSAFRNYTKAS
jgi:hypothetical protein